MKIGLVCAYDLGSPGGVTAHVRQMADQYAALGHRVKILGPGERSKLPDPSDRIIPLGKPIPIPAGGSIARLSFSIWILPHLRRLLSREGFDVVHVHEPLAPVLPLSALEVSPAVNVGTFHAYLDHDRYYALSHILLRRWANRLHGRVACSPASFAYASRFFPGDYRQIPDGVDAVRFSPAVPPLAALRDGKINILFVGRMEKRKGLPVLLAAYAKLRREVGGTRLVVVGPGKLDPESARLLADADLRGDVALVGAVSDAVLPQYYAAADVFCSPATGNESLGIVLLEAMASGKPVVASRNRGYATVVSEGRDGILVPPGNADALASALLTLVRDEALREQLAQQGLQAVRRYSWEVVAPEMLAFYDLVANRRPFE